MRQTEAFLAGPVRTIVVHPPATTNPCGFIWPDQQTAEKPKTKRKKRATRDA